jgi:phosphatidylglycerophosphatase A
MTRLIATFLGVGNLPGAPGTWGSLAALPCAWALHYAGSFPLLAAMTFVVFWVGLWSARSETAGQENHDPSEIVIDEVVGQWIALFPLSLGLWLNGSPAAVFPWPGWVLAFLAFRFFDVLKPWPVSVADRRDTPMGLMMDDVLAGILAALVVIAAAAIAHRVML